MTTLSVPPSGASSADASSALAPDLRAVDAWWRAANYLSVGQIYLLGNPMLREPLRPEQLKPRLLGHWGTTPGLNLVLAHLNRVVRRRAERDVMYVLGPGHGGPAAVAHAWLDGTWTATYSDVGLDEAGMTQLFRQFSFPGGIPSHVAPDVPGSIHEGGELGYSLAHAYGAVLDHPDLVVACVVGDGEAETGPLATSWHANKFVDPACDGAVLPILHLNDYKIANPTILARISDEERGALLEGYGHDVLEVAGDEPDQVHRALAAALDVAFARIVEIQTDARHEGAAPSRPRWPMIVLRTPKGWTGPAVVDGLEVEGTWRAHQVPLARVREDADHRRQLEEWMRSYRPEELFTDGRPSAAVLANRPDPASRRLSATPYANGGALLRDLELPDFGDAAVRVDAPGAVTDEATARLGEWLRAVVEANPDRFRLFAPDELLSNRLGAVLDATDRAWMATTRPVDEHLAPTGRVIEVLSEHLCEGLLEGYLLTGRHGIFTSYEAFVHVVDSMFNQHAKWLRTAGRLPWRRPVASLNYLLTSHVWRQDHNGFSHQDPGFIDLVVNKSGPVRVYLPPDANTLLVVMNQCLRSRDLVNVVVSGKQPAKQWFTPEAAWLHCARGLGILEWASTDGGGSPDVVLGCAGDVPTLEVLAAAGILRRELPDLRVRVVNVIDLMRMQPPSLHPCGLDDSAFDGLFTTDRPIVFAYHGYPWLVHRLTYRRHNHHNLHVRGYIDEGTTTTPFDMVMMNDLDRYRLVVDVIDRVPGLSERAAPLRQRMLDTRHAARRYTRVHGEDPPEITDWVGQPQAPTNP